MKKLALVSFLLIMFSVSSVGQWYQKKYQVNDINSLSLEQLQESLHESKKGTSASLIITGAGALLILGGLYIPYQVDENSKLFEQVMGSKGMSILVTSMGVLCAVGGTISTFAHLERTSKIKTTIKRNFPGTVYLNISPEIMFNKFSRTSSAGVSLTINF